jgi:quercetin dioxygenase-like cupin family protein
MIFFQACINSLKFRVQSSKLKGKLYLWVLGKSQLIFISELVTWNMELNISFGSEVVTMVNFPEPILNLPEADIPLKGVKAFLSQGSNHQIIFMEFADDVELPEHSHASQWGIVLEGRIELVTGGVKKTYKQGDRYFIPEGVKHSGKIFAGYADMTYFDQKDRYGIKKTNL